MRSTAPKIKNKPRLRRLGKIMFLALACVLCLSVSVTAAFAADVLPADQSPFGSLSCFVVNGDPVRDEYKFDVSAGGVYAGLISSSPLLMTGFEASVGYTSALSNNQKKQYIFDYYFTASNTELMSVSIAYNNLRLSSPEIVLVLTDLSAFIKVERGVDVSQTSLSGDVVVYGSPVGMDGPVPGSASVSVSSQPVFSSSNFSVTSQHKYKLRLVLSVPAGDDSSDFAYIDDWNSVNNPALVAVLSTVYAFPFFSIMAALTVSVAFLVIFLNFMK